MFQSLFSWNLLLMEKRAALMTDTGLVSILVFVELALDAWNWGRLVPTGCVSILVFVELALDVYKIQLHTILLGCFNPCFRGTCS